MTDITVDFETYYDTEYSLSKLMTAQYIYDPRFEVIGVSVKVGDGFAEWCSGTHEYLNKWLSQFDWANARVIAHNALFDGAILEWKFGFKPAKYFCTMMASRPHVVPYTDSMSLEAVAKHLGVGEKGHEVENHKGRNRVAFTSEQLGRYAAYCKGDVVLSYGIFKHLHGILPADEQDLIDLTIKKFTRPVLLLDKEAIEDRACYLRLVKAAALDSVNQYGATLSSIRSRPRFIESLKKLGITIPMKKTTDSKGLVKDTAALSKKDPEFLALLAHENEAVRKLVAAKLELGSTIEESRLKRFGELYDCVPGHKLPVPLLYYGAHPGRFSGLDGLNLQNLPRPKDTDVGRAALRKSIIAPPGHMIIAADFSNIEARIVATLAGQWDLVEAFRRGDDVYSLFASKIYKRTINKKTDRIERFVGKTCILGLGYGMGFKKLILTLATADPPVVLTPRQGSEIVYLYRDTYDRIKTLWNTVEQLTRDHVAAPASIYVWNNLSFTKGRIILPNGMPLMYPGINIGSFGTMVDGERYLWGGSLTENIVQALARIIATRAELRLARAGLRAVHQAHDELIFCVPEEHVDACENVITRVMTDPVPWMPRLPIAVEVHHGPTYGDCK